MVSVPAGLAAGVALTCVRARIAWVVAGVTGLLTVVDTAMVAASYELLSTKAIGIHGWPLVNIAALGTRGDRRRDPGVPPAPPDREAPEPDRSHHQHLARGRVVRASGCWSTTAPAPLRKAHLGGWTAAVLGGPLALAALTVVFLVVPAGTYLSPGWRWVARAGLGRVCRVRRRSRPDRPESDQPERRRRSTPVPVARILLTGGIILIALMILASVVSIAHAAPEIDRRGPRPGAGRRTRRRPSSGWRW